MMRDTFGNWRSGVLLLAAILLLPAAAHAQQTVRGTLNADTIWRAADGPYTLTGDVTVASHATLTIEPGTEIRVATSDELESGSDSARVELIVQGRLLAEGTAEEPVLFRSTASTRNRWVGIIVAPQAQPSVLRHVEVRQARYGLWARQSSALTLEDLVLRDNETAIRWEGDGALTLMRSEVRGFVDGIHVAEAGDPIEVTLDEVRVVHGDREGVGVHLPPRVSATIARSDVMGTGVGIDLESGASLDLRNSVVAGNTLIGVRVAQGPEARIEIVNNTIDLNVRDLADRTTDGVGIDVTVVTSAGDFIIRNNSVTRHGTAGIRRQGSGASPAVDHNNVWGNGTNYSGLSEGVGSLSVNPLYREGIGYATESETPNWSTSSNNALRSDTRPLAHRSRVRVTLTNRYNYCNSRLTRRTEEHGTAREQVISHPGTGTHQTWSGPILSDSFTTTYNRATWTECGIATSGRIDEIEWSLPGVDGTNYRVEPSSPLIDAGSALLAPTRDRDGAERPYDGNLDGTARTDIGAYEWRENVAPVAVGTVTPGLLVLPDTELTFDGRASYDPDGTIVRHTWDFGDGDTTDAAVTTRTFPTLGTRTATLTVEDDRGETHSTAFEVEIADNLPPIARLGNDRFAAIGETLTFDGSASSDPDGTIVAYDWSFGDGSPGASGLSVTHSFARAGVFEVTLTVTDNRGATGSASIFAVIGGGGTDPGPDPAIPPTARISLPILGTAGSPVALDASDSLPGDNDIASWTWDFGDGNTGSGETVTHTWDAPGSFLVRLTVTDNDGETDSDFAVAQIAPAESSPAAGPTARAGGPYATTLGGSLAFDASASTAGDDEDLTYRWDFGDGNSATGLTASHTYTAAGGWLVRLTVTDGNGLMDTDFVVANVRAPGGDDPAPLLPPVADGGSDRRVDVGETVAFDGSGSTSPNGDIVQWHWNFGDGSTASGTTASHAWSEAGTWLVRLTVTDDAGATAFTLIAVQVGQAGQPGPISRAPLADAGPSHVVEIGATITLDGSGSRALDGELVDWTWDLGDGNTASGETVEHAWSTAGLFVVRLTVTDDNGGTARDLTTVTVTAFDEPGPSQPDPSVPGATDPSDPGATDPSDPGATDPSDPGATDPGPAPVAQAGDDLAANAGTALTFSAAASTVRDPLAATFAWDFGDGNTAEGLSARHTWDEGGLYTVTLTVRDDLGRTATDSLRADINALPLAHAGGDRTVLAGQEVTLDGSLSSDPDGELVSFSWRLGDGTSASGETVTHTWQDPGSYTVHLTVEDDRGATATGSAVITVEPASVGEGAPSGSSSGGCSTAPGRAPAWPAFLILAGLIVLRRRR
ncbi:MAG: PKD domain-containing protein [Deltaproteobacteria bacterium]|nr:MAG: PKD domain-containing protein [Deltaproteobacteria bacterium]